MGFVRNLWTVDEVEILKKNLNISDKELVKLLPNHTYASIRAKKRYLMGGKKCRYGHEGIIKVKQRENILSHRFELLMKSNVGILGHLRCVLAKNNKELAVFLKSEFNKSLERANIIGEFMKNNNEFFMGVD